MPFRRSRAAIRRSDLVGSMMDPAGAAGVQEDGYEDVDITEEAIQNEQMARQMQDQQELMRFNDLVAYFSQDSQPDPVQDQPPTYTPGKVRPIEDYEPDLGSQREEDQAVTKQTVCTLETTETCKDLLQLADFNEERLSETVTQKEEVVYESDDHREESFSETIHKREEIVTRTMPASAWLKPPPRDETLRAFSPTSIGPKDETVTGSPAQTAARVENLDAISPANCARVHMLRHESELGSLLLNKLGDKKCLDELGSESLAVDGELMGAEVSAASSDKVTLTLGDDNVQTEAEDDLSEMETGDLEQKNLQHMANKLSSCLTEVKQQEQKIQADLKEVRQYEKLLVKSRQKLRQEEARLKKLKEKGKRRATKLSIAVGEIKGLE